MNGPTDAELDAWILTRLKTVGIDLSVLPEDDTSAPADRRRILESARRMLRTTVPTISDFSIDPQEVPPFLYPASLSSVVAPRDAAAGGEE